MQYLKFINNFYILVGKYLIILNNGTLIELMGIIVKSHNIIASMSFFHCCSAGCINAELFKVLYNYEKFY